MATKTGVVVQGSSNVLQNGGVDFSAADIAYEIGVRFWHLLEGVLILVVGILIMRYIRSYLQKIQTSHENQRMALNLLEKLISGFLVVVTVTLALKVIGLDLTLLISALALGLSFGLKDIIKNYISGILILFKSPFAIGDIVRIKKYTGRVERVDFQATTLKTFDRKEVTIYNKDILSRSIMNYSKEPMRRLEISLTLGRGTDLQKAIRVFKKILSAHSSVLKSPDHSIVFHSFTENGPRIIVRFWVQRPVNIRKIRSEIAFQIDQAFDEQSLFSPYSRSIQFTQDVSFNEGRKQRIAGFYGLPMLAGVAEQIANQVENTLVDEEEPEWEE